MAGLRELVGTLYGPTGGGGGGGGGLGAAHLTGFPRIFMLAYWVIGKTKEDAHAPPPGGSVLADD